VHEGFDLLKNTLKLPSVISQVFPRVIPRTPVDRGRESEETKKELTPQFSLTPQFDVSRRKPGSVYYVMSSVLKVGTHYAGQQEGITAIAMSLQCFSIFSCILY
jgi:hypothetical protein